MSELLTAVYEVRCEGDDVRRAFSLAGLKLALRATRQRRRLIVHLDNKQRADGVPEIKVEDRPITITAYTVDKVQTKKWTVLEEDDEQHG